MHGTVTAETYVAAKGRHEVPTIFVEGVKRENRQLFLPVGTYWRGGEHRKMRIMNMERHGVGLSWHSKKLIRHQVQPDGLYVRIKT